MNTPQQKTAMRGLALAMIDRPMPERTKPYRVADVAVALACHSTAPLTLGEIQTALAELAEQGALSHDEAEPRSYHLTLVGAELVIQVGERRAEARGGELVSERRPTDRELTGDPLVNFVPEASLREVENHARRNLIEPVQGMADTITDQVASAIRNLPIDADALVSLERLVALQLLTGRRSGVGS